MRIENTASLLNAYTDDDMESILFSKLLLEKDTRLPNFSFTFYIDTHNFHVQIADVSTGVGDSTYIACAYHDEGRVDPRYFLGYGFVETIADIITHTRNVVETTEGDHL